MTDQAALNMNRPGPALSATSDAPVTNRPAPALSAVGGKQHDVATRPAEAKVEVKTEGKVDEKSDDKGKKVEGESTEGKTPEEIAAAAKAKDKNDDQDDTRTPEQKKADAAVQREITKERNKRREAVEKEQAASERAEAAEKRLDAALKALETATGQNAGKTKAEIDQADPRPQRAQFDDPDKYEAALIDWTARTTTKAVTAKAEQDRVERESKEKTEKEEKANAEAMQSLQKEWMDRREKAIEEFPDYVEVAESDDVIISIPMTHAIINADNGPAIAYHLGKHPKEAERIAGLSPTRQAIEIGRISARLEEKPAVQVSKAAAPIKPLNGSSKAVEKGPDEMSMEEYAAKRNAQLRAGRAGGAAKPS